MDKVYMLKHKLLVEIDEETGEEVCDTSLLGFFSSEDNCENAIASYLEMPGFCEYPDRFFIEEVDADIDYYNDIVGEFEKYVYYLSHEWYDGEYDYVTNVGFYSTRKKANNAMKKYAKSEEFKKHKDGFCIDQYLINEMHWRYGR